MSILPFLDAGVIIIIFTIIIKLILLPLSIKASKTQLAMRHTEKDLALIKEKYKDKNEQAIKTMEYYKEHGINPFASFFILLIQIPILIGLYRVFLRSGLPNINKTMLYPFIFSLVPAIPINMVFLHLINISQKSLVLAIIAGITAYIQISLSTGPSVSGAQGDIARAMQFQMKYFFPILLGFIAYTISSAVALYLITSNIFAILQEIYIKKKYHRSTMVV
jgi:YidC/Oxa1 family membrane protein insertase